MSLPPFDELVSRAGKVFPHSNHQAADHALLSLIAITGIKASKLILRLSPTLGLLGWVSSAVTCFTAGVGLKRAVSIEDRETRGYWC